MTASTNTLAYAHPMQEAVAVFHRASGAPDLIADPAPLSAERMEQCRSLIDKKGMEELSAAIESGDRILQIEVLMEILCAALGGLVEMGVPVLDMPSTVEEARRDPLVDSTERASFRIRGACRVLRTLSTVSQVVLDVHSEMLFSMLARVSFEALANEGIDPWPFFNEIQRANMASPGDEGRDLARVYRELYC